MLARLSRLAVAVALLFATPALALEGKRYDGPGIYFGGSMNFLVELFKTQPATLIDASDPMAVPLPVDAAVINGAPVPPPYGNSLAGSIRAGYRAHPRFALETELEIVEGFDAATENLDGFFWTVNAKYFIRTGRWQPYLVGGLGVLSAKLDVPDSDAPSGVGFSTRWGAGVDYYVTDNLALLFNVTYWVPFGEVEDLHALSMGVGFQYMFRFSNP